MAVSSKLTELQPGIGTVLLPPAGKDTTLHIPILKIGFSFFRRAAVRGMSDLAFYQNQMLIHFRRLRHPN
jgi:hypothetical protein